MRPRLGLILAILLFAGLCFGVRNYVIDDTFIHLQYAKNFRHGLGLVFNPGEAVPGTTSPLWSLLLGWLPTFGLDLLLFSKLLGITAGFAALALFWRAACGLMERRMVIVIATFAWAANAWMSRWTPSGMETPLAVLLVLAGWLVGRARGEGTPSVRSRFLVGVLWGLASLIRPEAVILLAAYIFFSALLPRGFAEKVEARERLAALLAPVVGASLVVIPYAAYSYSIYGTLLPGTLAAKSAGGVTAAVAIERLIHSGKILAVVCGVESVALLLLATRLGALLRRGDAALHAACWAWLVAIPLGYALRGVPVISRYLVPLMPLLVLYGWAAIEQWWLRREGRARRNVVVAALLVAMAANLSVYFLQVRPHTAKFVAGMERTLIPWGRWLGENAEADAVVATPDIGAIGYYSGRQVLDLGGLVTPEIVPIMRRMPYDEMVRSFAFREAGRPAYLVDRGFGENRLLRQSPFSTSLTPLFSARTQSLGITFRRPVDYALYRIDWHIVDSLSTRLEPAGSATR